MMKFAGIVCIMTAVAALVLPAVARADSAQRAYDFETRQTDELSAGEYDGRLRMRIGSDGIVSGTFTNTEGQFSSIIGGVTGTKIWIDIGNASPTSEHLFNGTFTGDKLLATAPHGLHVWTLEGSPRTHY